MITNHSPNRVRRPLNTELFRIYHPEEGDWSYSHHASVCHFQGKMYAMWSNGRIHEDDIGQRVLYSISENGSDWSEPRVLFPSQPGYGVLTASGFHVCGDTLAAYAGLYVYDPSNISDGHVSELGAKHVHTALFRIESKDGWNWSEPEDLHIPLVPNHGPQKTKSGRLIISGNILFPYTDDPYGKTGWKLSATPPFPWEPLYDDSEGFIRRANAYGREWLCEGSFYQTKDGVLHMLQRSLKRVLFVSESADDGATWSESAPTEFTDCCSKFHCGTLPDGRTYIVSNPDAASPRCPLVLSLSRDGQNFDREYIIDDRFIARRIEGHAKGGIYGYPHTAIVGNDMYAICSVNKEDIHVYRFSLDELKEE